MSEPTPYEVLGVAPTASADEIRRAYLALARASHPDLQRQDGRGAAEERMRRINAAWAILGDEARRRRYDEEWRRAVRAGTSRGASSGEFIPIVDDDTDYAAVLDDTPVSGTTVSRLLQVLPAALWIAGVPALVSGFVAGFPPLLALGVICLVLGGVAFVAVPALAVARSYQDDRS